MQLHESRSHRFSFLKNYFRPGRQKFYGMWNRKFVGFWLFWEAEISVPFRHEKLFKRKNKFNQISLLTNNNVPNFLSYFAGMQNSPFAKYLTQTFHCDKSIRIFYKIRILVGKCSNSFRKRSFLEFESISKNWQVKFICSSTVWEWF